MKPIDALTVSVALLGAILTYLALGPAAGVFFIWAVFVATALGVALGGTTAAFKDVVVGGIYGVVLASLAALVVINVSGPAAPGLWPAIVVLVFAALLVQTSRIPALSSIPAVVMGFALSFAYLLQTPDVLTNDVLLGATIANPLVNISLSIIVGAAYGIGLLAMTAKLSKAEVPPAPAAAGEPSTA